MSNSSTKLADFDPRLARSFENAHLSLNSVCSPLLTSSLARLEDESQRYSLWSRNLGLGHAKSHLSLDYRLQNAPNLKKTVSAFLEDLCEALLEGKWLHPFYPTYIGTFGVLDSLWKMHEQAWTRSRH